MKAKTSGFVVSLEWDDGSITDTTIIRGLCANSGPYVAIADREGEEIVYLYPESWPEIRDKIQLLFDSIEQEQEEA